MCYLPGRPGGPGGPGGPDCAKPPFSRNKNKFIKEKWQILNNGYYQSNANSSGGQVSKTSKTCDSVVVVKQWNLLYLKLALATKL